MFVLAVNQILGLAVTVVVVVVVIVVIIVIVIVVVLLLIFGRVTCVIFFVLQLVTIQKNPHCTYKA